MTDGRIFIVVRFRFRFGHQKHRTTLRGAQPLLALPTIFSEIKNRKLQFYINEYKQVIVPVIGSSDYYLAGDYEKPLRFEFEGKILSGEPFDWNGTLLSPGAEWTGPHPGIPYVLAAGGSDIYYDFWPSPNIQKRLKLSKATDQPTAKSVAAIVREHKGFSGGRFYVNEFRTIFAPILEGNEWRHVYIGELDLKMWFPKPESL